MPDSPKTLPDLVAPEIIRVATGRVCASATFSQARQQQELLRFLVESHLSGSTTEETSAAAQQSLFGDRAPEEAQRKLTWALARLSEKLEEYFAKEGVDDPLHIHIDPQYGALVFHMAEGNTAGPSRPPSQAARRHLLPLIGVVVAIVVGGVTLLLSNDVMDGERLAPELQARLSPEKGALPEEYAVLTAVELEAVARDHLYPYLNIERQKMALQLTDAALAKDPSLANAYATAAYSVSARAILGGGGALSRRFLLDAQTARDKALALAPENAWVRAAEAMVAYAERDFERAKSAANAAFARDPEDPYVTGLFGMITHVTNQHDLARAATTPGRIKEPGVAGDSLERVYAFASFHLGDYQTTIDVIETELHDRHLKDVSAVMYLAAAYQAMGQHNRANALIRRVKREWPTYRPALVATMFFEDPSQADEQLQLLSAAGWSFVDGPDARSR